MKLVALDIDGTIVPKEPLHDQSLPLPPLRVRQAIRRLREAGIAVVLATGRMYRGTAPVARALQLDTPLICQQGCAIHAPDGSLLHVFRIDPNTALDIAEFARARCYPYEWFDPYRYVVSRPTPESALYARLSGVVAEYHPSPEALGFHPTGVGIISTHNEAPNVHRELLSLHGEALHLLDFPSVTVAVAPEANKGHALSIVAAALGVDRGEVLAIGDSVNDAPMLAWAGHGVTVAHADQYARDAADTVIGEGVEAVAEFLETLVDRA